MVPMNPFDILTEAERVLLRGDMQTSLEFAQLALEEFQYRRDNEGIAVAVAHNSSVYRQIFKQNASFYAINKAQMDAMMCHALVEREKLDRLRGFSYFQLGEVAMLLRNFEEAIFYLEKAVLSLHSRQLFEKGQYCFRLGEANYKCHPLIKKVYGKNLMQSGLRQIYEDFLQKEQLVVRALLVEDYLILARIFLEERNENEAFGYFQSASRLLDGHRELRLCRKRYDELVKYFPFV